MTSDSYSPRVEAAPSSRAGGRSSASHRHFEAGELLRVLEHGFDSRPARRRDAWLHFASGCTTCRQVAGSLRERESLFVASPSAWEDENADPLVLTLADLCLEERRRNPSPWLFPWHRAIIRTIDEEPLGLVRDFLEWTHHLGAAQHPRIAVEGSKAAVKSLELLLSKVARDRSRKAEVADLLALAQIYLAENLAARFAFEKAEESLQNAERRLGPVLGLKARQAGTPEIRAALYEARSELYRRQGEREMAGTCLEAAADFLKDSSLPGRHALNRTRHASLLTRMGETQQAIELLEQALEESPLELSLRLHLDISHRLAVAHFSQQNFTVTLEILAQLDGLYHDEHAPDLLRIQRAWLEGASYLYGAPRNRPRAEKPLEEALEGYLRLGLPEGGANAFLALYQLGILTGKTRSPEALLRYLPLLRSASEVEVLLEAFQHLRHEAETLAGEGFPFAEEIRLLEGRMRALEEKEEDRIN